MLSEADSGILFRAPENVKSEFPQYPAVDTYDELKNEFVRASERDLEV
jgi:phosphoserine/homoserine phosphotransferase